MAKSGRIYNSTSSYQIRGHILALAATQPIGVRAGAGSLSFVTTSDTGLAWSVYNAAWTNNIHVYHWQARYRFTPSGNMEIDFGVRHMLSWVSGPAYNPSFSPVQF